MDMLIEKLDHVTCRCNRPANLFQQERTNQVRYYVESHCCGLRTPALKDKRRAIGEYVHIMVLVTEDDELGVMP